MNDLGEATARETQRDGARASSNAHLWMGTGAALQVPDPHGVAIVRLADGASITLRRHGNPNGPRLVLSHANGFAADAYLPFWSLLLSRFDLIVYDLRNHGHNPSTDLASHHVPMMVWDNHRVVGAIDRHFGAKRKIGIFHSISAAIAIYQAAEAQSSFDALVLFDPPICPPRLSEARRARVEALGPCLAKRARSRRSFFDRWEDLAESYQRARGFERLVPGACELLAKATLRPRAGREGLELSCPAQYEANLLDQLYKWTVSIDLDALDFPVKVIGSDPIEPFSFLPSVDPALLIRIDYDFVPESSHFLQLEVPEDCVELMLDFLAKADLL